VGQTSSPSNCNLFEPPLKRRKWTQLQNLKKQSLNLLTKNWEFQRNIERISPCNLSLSKREDPSQDKPEVILFKFIPSSVWKILVDAINWNLSSGSTVSSQLKSRNRVATFIDVIHFYAITMMIENTWENDKRNLKKHFRDISEKYGSVQGMRVASNWAGLRPPPHMTLESRSVQHLQVPRGILQVPRFHATAPKRTRLDFGAIEASIGW
jgi:hypothetical protein